MRRLVYAFTIAGLATLLAAGCGNLYSDPTEPGPSFGPDTKAPAFGRVVDAAGTIPQDFPAPCAIGPRAEGTQCTSAEVGRVCEYGSSPDPQCNITVACTVTETLGPAWLARPSRLCPSYECPKGAAASVDGKPCALPSNDASPPSDSDELVCPMDDATCACTTGPDALHAHPRRWVCVKPTAGCPVERPLAGQSCTTPRLCDYGSCAWKRGLRMDCDTSKSSAETAWQTGGAPCN
jgi:hypothetical protein